MKIQKDRSPSESHLNKICNTPHHIDGNGFNDSCSTYQQNLCFTNYPRLQPLFLVAAIIIIKIIIRVEKVAFSKKEGRKIFF